MTSWHNTDILTNTVRTNFNHFSTLPQNLVLLWLILFEKYFFKHSNPVPSVVSEIKSGVRGSYAAEKVGTLKVNHMCHLTKFERYSFMSIQTHTSVKCTLYSISRVLSFEYPAIHHGSSTSTEKFARKWLQKCLLSHTTMALNEGQGHSNRYQTVQLTCQST